MCRYKISDYKYDADSLFSTNRSNNDLLRLTIQGKMNSLCDKNHEPEGNIFVLQVITTRQLGNTNWGDMSPVLFCCFVL